MNTKKYIYTFLVIGALCGGCTQWVDYSPKTTTKLQMQITLSLKLIIEVWASAFIHQFNG
jgi:hypothetical protein